MRGRSLAVAALSGILCCAAPSARAANGFMGHYGYLLTLPGDFSANPAFKGAIETVDLYPQACVGMLKRMDCVKAGMIELYALPKGMVAEQIGAKTLDAYVAAIRADAKKSGIKTRLHRGKRAGFSSALIEMLGHPEPLNTMLVIEGSKVYYRFKYNDKKGAKAAASIADSLKEVAPHDNPPAPGAP